MERVFKIKDNTIEFKTEHYDEIEIKKNNCKISFDRDAHYNHLCVEMSDESLFCLKDAFENIENFSDNTKTRASYYMKDKLYFCYFNETNSHRFFVKNPKLIDSFFISKLIEYQEREFSDSMLTIDCFSNEIIDKILLLDTKGLVHIFFEDEPIQIAGDYIFYKMKNERIVIPKLLKSCEDSSCDTKDYPLKHFFQRVQIVKNKRTNEIEEHFPNVKYFMRDA